MDKGTKNGGKNCNAPKDKCATHIFNKGFTRC